ncbi:MAG: GGDEF domain-containing protein [Lachnospiraceae bacterium]|nr:GGDEF domain-containing protein [Lachnospiraceae bacterium]
MSKKKTIRVGCMFWNYLANRTQQLVKELWEIFEESGFTAKFYLGTENHFFAHEALAESSKYDYQYSALSAYSRYDDFDLLIVSSGTLTISRSQKEADRVLSMLPKVPTIFIEDVREEEYGRCLILDNAGGIRDCTEHLINVHHCKRIGFICGPKESVSANERKQSFYDTMAAHGLSVDPADVIEEGNFAEGIDNLVEPLFAGGNPPEAIVSANDEMALAVYRVAKKYGYTIGKDILITGFDDISLAAYLDPPLTTSRQDFRKMAKQIVSIGIDMLSGIMPESCVYHTDLIIRGSCGCEMTPDSTEQKNEEAYDQLVNSFVNLQNMRSRLLSGANLNRVMLNVEDREAFRSMLASMMEIENLPGGRILLLDPKLSLTKDDPFELPESVYVSSLCRNGVSTLYPGDRMPALHPDEKRHDLDMPDGCSVAFLLYFEKYQYGILELQIGYQEIEHYYMQALEIGLGFRYHELVEAEKAARDELEVKNKKLDFAAYHDSLTGVWNHSGFLMQERAVIREHVGEKVAILMADLDHLKQINDNYGHSEGDRAIRLTSHALGEVLTNFNPVIGRTGGDEFSAIFPVPDDFDANECVEAIHKYCERFNETSDLPYYLGISVGCLKAEAQVEKKLRELFSEADVLLYADKKRRRMVVTKDGNHG